MKVWREKGQGLTEYAMILVLVAVVVIVILAILGPAVGNVFSNIIVAIDPLMFKPKMHVSAISVNASLAMGTVTANGTVTIVDEDGSPVPGATVNVRFRQLGPPNKSATDSGPTNASGQASVSAMIDGTGGGGTLELCVTGVSHADYGYDSGADAVSCPTDSY